MPPCCHVDQATTRAQENNNACGNNLYRRRWRRTAFTSGSYVRDAGGIEGAERVVKVEAIARVGDVLGRGELSIVDTDIVRCNDG